MWLYASLLFVGYLLGYIISSLFSVKAETDRLMDVYQHGYNTGLEEGKAHALTSGSFEEALAIIRESVEKSNKPKIKDSLF